LHGDSKVLLLGGLDWLALRMTALRLAYTALTSRKTATAKWNLKSAFVVCLRPSVRPSPAHAVGGLWDEGQPTLNSCSDVFSMQIVLFTATCSVNARYETYFVSWGILSRIRHTASQSTAHTKIAWHILRNTSAQYSFLVFLSFSFLSPSACISYLVDTSFPVFPFKWNLVSF
jgi:hypothetical protein